MDFTNTEEQVSLRDSVRRFVEREYDWDKRMAAIRSVNGVHDEHWSKMAELGWLGAGLSEADGGFGGGAVENSLLAEEFGAALLTEPFISHVIAAQMLAKVGGPHVRELIESMVAGTLRVVPALQELAGRGDWMFIETHAHEQDGAVLVSGAKSLVEGACKADFFIVSANLGNVPALFLVKSGETGLSRSPYRTIDNRRVADITLQEVPARILAAGALASDAMAAGVNHGLLILCAEGIGAMSAAMLATRDYLKVRKQFGVSISSFQALQHRMSDMLIETEMARSAVLGALGYVDDPDPDLAAQWTSAAKLAVAKAGLLVGSQAIQLHGGIGVTEELNISHYYRRLHAIARQLGDEELHLDRFANAFDRKPFTAAFAV